MATGRKPCGAPDPIDNLVTIIRGVPRADGTGCRITERLADVIARGLQSDPSARFQSAAQVAAALDATRPPPPQAQVWWRRHARGITTVALSPAVVWGLGWAGSAAFNNTLERTGVFAAERPADYFVWGVRSLVAPTVYALLAVVVFWAARFAVRVLALWAPAARLLSRATRRVHVTAERLGLNDPVNFAQGLASAGFVALVLVVWRFNDLIRAWGAFVSTGDSVDVWPLSTDNEPEKLLYRAVLTVLLLAFTAGLARVLQLRRQLAMHRGRGSVAAVTGIVICFLLLNEVPYRLMWQNKAYRFAMDGARCYAIGESPAQYLLYCPDAPPPRNRVVSKTDPGLRATGVLENIFTAPQR
jgi:hypothetical protein